MLMTARKSNRTKRKTKLILMSMSNNSLVQALDNRNLTSSKQMLSLKARAKVTSNNKIEELKRTTMMMTTKKKFQEHTTQPSMQIYQLVAK